MTKKAAKKSAAKKSAPKTKTTKNTAKKAVKKSPTKKATKKTPTKKAAKKAVQESLTFSPSHDDISAKALEIYNERISSGEEGSAESDWFAAIESLKNS